ncbi:SusC/RagA family TonB-linked outer membrane protein, partial [Pedobacter sp.]|uniref:SusC/RagA family TonB-linked outer membrane protein n=1 Tax=Pedobacter sp. TaxID=1411316 RepID=UPI002D1CA0C8
MKKNHANRWRFANVPLANLLRIMKLTAILLFVFAMSVSAGGFSQDAKVTLALKEVKLARFFKAIEKETNYRFAFSNDILPSGRIVTINVRETAVAKVLKDVLASTNLKYRFVDESGIIIISEKTENAAVADENAANVVHIVTGKVTGDRGEPLAGVTVQVKESDRATTTGENGFFSFDAGDNAKTLVFSFIGMETQEVVLAGRTSIKVNMVTTNKSMNEVVVTALGIKKEERALGYSVSTVNGNVLDKARETNVAYSLEGRVAGLQISGVNGGPGSSARILLRGVTSFSAGPPLFVINGVPMDNTQRGESSEWGGPDYGDGIGNINPDDIESLTVLKGQSASALYGSRAANGVILITTKSGKKNSGYGVEYNTNYQADKAMNNLDFQHIYGQGQNGAKPATANDALTAQNLAWGAKLDGTSVIQFNGKSYPYSNVNNWRSFYRTGGTFTNTLSFTGGNENGAFRLSMSDMNNKSMIPNSSLDRKTFNFKGMLSATKKLEINVVANYLVENSKNKTYLSDSPSNPNNVQWLTSNVDQHILAPGSNPNGSEMQYTNNTFFTNPYFAAYKFVFSQNRARFITALSGKYNFTNWLYAQARLGYDIINDSRVFIEPTGTAYISDKGRVEQMTSQITELNTDVLIGAKHDLIKDWLKLDVSAGGNIRKSSSNGIDLNGTGLIIPFFYSLSNLATHSYSYSYSALQTNSAYYTADFAIKNFLVLSTAGRYDVFSTLPSFDRSIFTPSVSGSFIFSDLCHINGLDFGKLRLSYASTSGAIQSAYSTSPSYGVGTSINGIPTGGFGSQLPNLFLKPYTLKEVEVGTALKFFGDRLGLDLDYFSRRTYHEIINGTIDVSSGYTGRYIGTGSTQNKGVELELHGTPVKTSDFGWTPAFNFTYVANKILQTDGTTNSNITFGTYRPLNANLALVVGKSGPQVMAYDYMRNAKG